MPEFDPMQYRVDGVPRVNSPVKKDGNFNIRAEMIKGKKQTLLTYMIQGYTLKECAIALGVSYTTVLGYCRDPQVKEQLRELSLTTYNQVYAEAIEHRVTAHQRILQMADDALTELEILIHDEDPRVRMKAVENVLDRHGEVSRATKNTSIQATIHLDAETLVAAAAAAREIESVRILPKGMIEADKPTREEA